MWVFARYWFGLTIEEFGELTLPEFWELWDQRAIEFRRACFLQGLTASAVYNVHRVDHKQPVLTPFDFSVRGGAQFMPVNIEKLERQFVFDGNVLPDPNPDMSVEQVRDMYIPAHPEITTATVTGPEPVDDKMRYTFSRAIGHKG